MQALGALQEHLGATSISKKDFCWFMTFLATFPSDDAFDVVRLCMSVCVYAGVYRDVCLSVSMPVYTYTDRSLCVCVSRPR